MIKPIKTKTDYQAALQTATQLMKSRRGTPEGDRLEVLMTLIEAYEARFFPLEVPDAVAAIEYLIEQGHLTRNDLVPYIGAPHDVCDILDRKRPLTLAMAWKLHKGLGIPAETLIRQVDHRCR